MVRFYNGTFIKSAFYNVRVNCSLNKEINCSNFFSFFFKYSYKFFSDNLSFLFWICNSGKFIVEIFVVHLL